MFSIWHCEQLKSSPLAAKLEGKNQGNPGIRMSKCFDKPKLNVQVDPGTNFTAWKAQWEAYRSLSGLDKESQVKQVIQLTANHFQLSSSQVQRWPKRQPHTAAETFNTAHAHNLPEIRIGCNVAVQDSETKLWDIYGIVTDIGPHR